MGLVLREKKTTTLNPYFSVTTRIDDVIQRYLWGKRQNWRLIRLRTNAACSRQSAVFFRAAAVPLHAHRCCCPISIRRPPSDTRQRHTYHTHSRQVVNRCDSNTCPRAAAFAISNRRDVMRGQSRSVPNKI